MQRLQHIYEMLKSEPNDSFLNYALALEYGKMNNIQKAIEIIEELLARDEDYLGAYYQLGKFYELIEERQTAIEKYTKGLVVARKQNNKRTLRELKEAILMLEEDTSL